MEIHEEIAAGGEISDDTVNASRQQHERALVARANRFYWLDQIRKSYTKKGKFAKSFLHLDYENGEGQSMEPGDGGRGAAVIRAYDEPEPAWLVAFDEAFARLDSTELAVACALLEDCRPARAARFAGVSRMTVYRVMHALRAHFDRAYRLYKMRDA